MTASATHATQRGNRYHSPSTLESLTRPFQRARSAVWQALMRCAVAYERTAQERIMRELALSHPQLVAEIRASRAAEAAGSAPRALGRGVMGMWE